MVINTNITALTSANNLNNSTNMLNASLARLSSGSKISTPADDPAGLAESISLTAQISQVGAANSNVSNAVSFAQTQDGYLQQIGSALDQMATLAVEAQDGTKTDAERADYQKQFSTLSAYITDTAAKNFNGVSLFSAGSLTVTTDGSGDTFSMTGVDLSTSAYSGATAADITTTTGAASALTAVTAAIVELATDRATVGANEQRLNYTGQQLSVLQTNLSAANSQITDVDVAQESTSFAKYQILVQAGTSMLAQANQSPQSVLKLLQ
ncbi:MAG TPA: flagellin [Verrucomicrobiae bacterium]|jgi:flagellin|nr:flagellin [Verrucomicrobiae bacterium]